MENLTIHNRINFKSHFNPTSCRDIFRIKRVEHYGHLNQAGTNYKTFDIPYWNELQTNVIRCDIFKSKF